MSFTHKEWKDYPDQSTPLDAAALKDQEDRLSAYTDSSVSAITSTKGNANGIASLDSAGKVPATQLPNSIMEYQGTWNASTNTPTLADGGSHNTGDVYRVSVGGTRDLGSGALVFDIGDYAVYNVSGKWEKSDTTDAVASVAGKTGVVTLDTSDISGLGGAATKNVGTTTGTVAAGDDARFTDTRTPTDGSVTAAKVAATLKPSGSAATTDEALRKLGTGAGDAAAGNDSRITGAAQKASNLLDLASASTARTNLGLGSAATSSTDDFIAASSSLTVVKTADQTINNSSFPQADDQLKLSFAAGSAYNIRVFLILQALSTNPDWKFQWVWSAGTPTYLYWGRYLAGANSELGGSTTAQSPAQINVAGNATTVGSMNGIHAIVFEAVYKNTVASDLTWWWAQNTATAEDSKVLAGSHMIARKL